MTEFLSGQRLVTTDLNEDSDFLEDTTSGTTTSTTFTNLSTGAFELSLVVPASGKVSVDLRATGRNSGANNSVTSWTASGSSSGVVYTENNTAAVIVTGAANVSLSISHLLTGLEPLETLTVRMLHRVNVASTATFDYRSIRLLGESLG